MSCRSVCYFVVVVVCTFTGKRLSIFLYFQHFSFFLSHTIGARVFADNLSIYNFFFLCCGPSLISFPWLVVVATNGKSYSLSTQFSTNEPEQQQNNNAAACSEQICVHSLTFRWQKLRMADVGSDSVRSSICLKKWIQIIGHNSCRWMANSMRFFTTISLLVSQLVCRLGRIDDGNGIRLSSPLSMNATNWAREEYCPFLLLNVPDSDDSYSWSRSSLFISARWPREIVGSQNAQTKVRSVCAFIFFFSIELEIFENFYETSNS